MVVVRSGERRSSIYRTPGLKDLVAHRRSCPSGSCRGTTALAGEGGKQVVVVVVHGDVGQGGRICEVGRIENIESAD